MSNPGSSSLYRLSYTGFSVFEVVITIFIGIYRFKLKIQRVILRTDSLANREITYRYEDSEYERT
jgi:hypothetical protein